VFDLSNQALINSLLSSSVQDIIGCLTNCSSKGSCKSNSLTSKFMCECNAGFAGSKCDINLKICSYFPCLNSGQCIELSTSSSYMCNCTKYYTGERCENKKDLCQNVSCSSNGVCVDVNDTAVCKCFNLYSGENCEIKSIKLSIVKMAQTISVVIVILSFVLVALVVFILDLKCGKEKKNTKKIIKRFIYKP
jgi:hypothetical protein